MARLVKTLKSSLLTALVATMGLISHAQASDDPSIIKPFGPFTWDAGFWGAIEQAQSIDGVEKIEVLMEGSELLSDDHGISERKLKSLLSDKYNDAMLDKRLMSAKQMGSTCVDADGKELVYITQSAKIRVSPILIANVPFVAELTFKPSCGFLIQSPNAVLTDSSDKIKIPYQLVNVELKSTAPNLADNVVAISKSLYEKYQPFQATSTGSIFLEKNDMGIRADYITDKDKNMLRAECNPTTCTISYKSDNQVYNNAYKAHLTEIQNEKNKGKADMSSGL